jgi:NAD(P)-binding Rossmann-like domain
METDYLVIGAGAMGLAFADEMLTRSDAHITIVDRRHAPGGHWNDAYPFVRLHQPSVLYGVESRELSDLRIDDSGPNKGYLSLADGSEVVHYFHSLMRERLLPSGRVTFLPMCEVEPDGAIRSLLSRERRAITVRKKVVNAAYLTNSVPRTHSRKFSVAADVTCVPPNDLPQLAGRFACIAVLGAGKTAVDTCSWLLANGTPPDAIRWIVPRDAWFVNRANLQPTPEFFSTVFGNAVAEREALTEATSVIDFAHHMEAAGAWLRIDPKVEPSMYHAASISLRELAELRRIRDVVRMGRVRAIEPQRLLLEGGELATRPDTLYVDCTAIALARPPVVPVFQEQRITLQLVRFPQMPFSAALTAFLEATMESDEEKNGFVAPIRLSDTVADYVAALVPDWRNRSVCNRHEAVRTWIQASRTDGYAKLVHQTDPNDVARQNILLRLREATRAAAQNLPRLLAQPA